MAAYSGPGSVLYNGIPLLEVMQMDLDYDSGNKDVDTLAKGNAGFSTGPGKAQVMLKNALPTNGPEVDWLALSMSKLEIQLTFVLAGKYTTLMGDVRNVKASSSNTGENTFDMTFHGRVVAAT